MKTLISQPPNKDADDWAQSMPEAEHPIAKLTVEGDMVLDPMMGRLGTTGIAAKKLTRKFIGIEIDENNYRLAKANINKLVQ